MEIVFDLIIFFYLGAVGVYIVHGLHFWKETKKRGLLLAIFCLLFLSWIVIFYGSFIEPRMLVVNRQELRLSDHPTQSINAVIFSDLHVGIFKKTAWTKRVVDKVNSLRPDLVVIPGDFVVSSQNDTRWLEPLSNLSATYGVYAVTGNHEYKAEAENEVVLALQQAGIIVLRNESLAVEINGKILRLAGVSDIWFDGNLEKTLANVKDEDATILIAHNPDIVLDKMSRLADAVFAGHTHGGQIRLPLIGPVPALPTKLGREYDRGWFDYDGLKLFITSGVGETSARARLLAQPEIVQMQIHF